MHYKWNAFSNNGQATITRKDGGNELELGNNSGLSTEDARQINSLYKEQCGKCNFVSPVLSQWSSSIPPENVRKPLLF